MPVIFAWKSAAWERVRYFFDRAVVVLPEREVCSDSAPTVASRSCNNAVAPSADAAWYVWSAPPVQNAWRDSLPERKRSISENTSRLTRDRSSMAAIFVMTAPRCPAFAALFLPSPIDTPQSRTDMAIML